MKKVSLQKVQIHSFKMVYNLYYFITAVAHLIKLFIMCTSFLDLCYLKVVLSPNWHNVNNRK